MFGTCLVPKLPIHESWLVTSQFHFPPSMSKVMNDTYFSLNVRKSLLGLSSMFILQLPLPLLPKKKCKRRGCCAFSFLFNEQNQRMPRISKK